MITTHSPKGIRLIPMVLFGLWVSGCSGMEIKTPPTDELRLLKVPFFPDNTDQCGPSALASVLAFWGAAVDPPSLKNEIYLAHLKGSLPLDLLLAAQNRGFKARLYSGSLSDIKSELKKGRPLVAFINRGFDFFPIGHYVVISGFDEARQGLYVHSGLKENKFIRNERFLKDWEKTERSTLLVIPPGQAEDIPHDGA